MKIQKRTQKGSKIRSNNKIPGVIYGGGLESTAIEADLLEFTNLFREKGTSKTFEVKLDGKKHIVYIREVQKALMNQHLFTHFDLVKVSADDIMTSEVRISLLNKDVVEKKGLIVNSTLQTVNLEYQVGKGISFVEVDIAHLEEHDSLLISDLVVSKDMKILNDPSQIILSISKPREEVIEEDEEEEITEVEAIKQKDQE